MANLLVLGSYGDIVGGIPTVLNSVVPRLKESFDEILVISPRKRRKFIPDFNDGNIRVRYQPCGSIPRLVVSQPFIEIVRVWQRIKKELEVFKPDVTWVNDETLQMSAKIAGLKNTVRTVHGLPRETITPEKEVENIYERKLYMLVHKYLEREGLKDITAITTYSNYLKNKIRSLYNTTAPIYVIPNGIDPLLFRPTHSSKENVIVYVGYFAIIKGVHILLQAMKHVHKLYPNWKLWLVGNIFDQSKEYFEGIYNRGVIWTGRIPHRDMPRIINQSKIFVMPTLRDGFEIALMEAVACGVPSITTEAYERKEIYKNLVTFCKLNDYMDLARKMIYLIENWEECYKKAYRASEVTRNKFSWDPIAKEYLSVFKHVLQD